MDHQPVLSGDGLEPRDNGPPGQDRPRILLAIEDASLRDEVERILADSADVEGAADREAVLAIAGGRPPDLVIAGVAASQRDGWLRALRSDPRTASGPALVIVDGAGGDEQRLEGLDARADDFLVSPFHPSELRARVRLLLERSRHRRESEEVLRRGERRFVEFMEHLPGLSWIKDLQGRYVYANHAAEQAFGTPRDLLYGRSDDEVFPPETALQFRENDQQALAGAAGIRTIEALAHPDGLVHHSIVSKFPIPGGNGAAAFIGGMAIDITELKTIEAALRQSEEQFRQLADAVPQIVYILTPDGRAEYWNQRGSEFLGGSPAARPVLAEVVHPEDLPTLRRRWSEVIERGGTFEAEFRLKRASDGEFRWFLTRALPVRDAQGVLTKWFGTSTDIDDRKRAEQRLDLLAGAGRLLSSSLDDELTLANVCRLVIPVLADWCLLDLLGEDGRLRGREVAHKDPVPVEFARAVQRSFLPRPDPARGRMNVLESGEPELLTHVSDESLARTAQDSESLAILHALGLRSVMIVPLKARGRTLGALTLIAAGSSRRYDEDDLRLALELGARVALAVDNARLFAEAREAVRLREEALRLHCRIEEQLTLLVEASGGLSTSLDMAAVLGAILALSRRLVAADAYAVWRHEATTGRWGIVLASGLSEAYQQATIEVLELTPRLSETPVIAEDIDAMPQLGHRREAHQREGIRAMLVMPLSVRGSLSGTLVFYYRTPHRFSEVEVRIGTALANLAASAIGSAELYDELRANDRRKDEFLAMLAHELRNPLAAISNAAALIGLAGPWPEPIAWGMEIIGRQMKHLVRLIDDLLDVSRITRGKIQLRKVLVDAQPVLTGAVESVRSFIEERKHHLTVRFDPGLTLEADPTRLEQIVVNLLTNAAKYTESGGQIWLMARREEAEVVIRVRDTGIGIAPEQLPKMFDLFAQGDRSLARAEGGLGIGLTLVQKLAEMHGGAVHARSQGPGTGSEFIVRLPAAPPPSRRSPTGTSQPSPPPAPSAARILVVDDNRDTAHGLARFLGLFGHDAQIAYDGPSALDKAREWRPHFILLDIGLPGMNGYEVAARLRSQAGMQDAIIIALSGYGQDEDRRRSQEAGCDAHLVKPIDHDTLLKTLGR